MEPTFSVFRDIILPSIRYRCKSNRPVTSLIRMANFVSLGKKEGVSYSLFEDDLKFFSLNVVQHTALLHPLNDEGDI